MKATDDQILTAIVYLRDKQIEEWKYIYGPECKGFKGLKREDIQQEVQEMLHITYTASGFRSRLLKFEKNGVLDSLRVGDKTKYYIYHE